MRSIDLLRFSAGALRGHRLRTVLSLMGVAIGVASVILLTSLGQGARLYVTGEFASLGSNLLIVMPGKTETMGAAPMVSTATHDLTMADAEALAHRVPQIRMVSPLCLGTTRAGFGDRSREVTVVGTTREILDIRRLRMGVGRFLPPNEPDAPVCVLGTTVRRELFGDSNPLGEMLRLGDARLRIIGVMSPRGTSIGTNMDEVVFIPVEPGLHLFNLPGLFRLMAEVRSHRDLDAARLGVLAVLKERHGGMEDVTALTQDAVLSTFDKILGVLTATLAGIAAISLSVAGIGIMNVMLVSREVGLLKALGVTAGQITGVFLIEASMISTAGGLLGLAAGVALGRLLQQFYPEFPVQAPVWAVIAALVVSVSVGVLFGSLPARRAARLDPVEALMRRRT